MELKTILELVSKRLGIIAGVSILAGLTGTGVVLVLPYQYTAQGLLVVTRKADTPSDNVFTYEGYYAQQNAQAYTVTFLSILLSPSTLSNAGTGIGTKKLIQLIKAKKNGGQAINFSVKGNSPQEAHTLWVKIADSAIASHNALTPTADPLISVDPTLGSPVVVNSYPAWYKVLAAGFTCSVILASFLIILGRYLAEEKR